MFPTNGKSPVVLGPSGVPYNAQIPLPPSNTLPTHLQPSPPGHFDEVGEVGPFDEKGGFDYPGDSDDEVEQEQGD